MVVADFIILAILGIGAYKGYKDGLLVTVISFFAFVIAILSAFKLMDNTMKWLDGYISNNRILPFVSFVLLFVVVYVGILYLSKFLKSSLDYTLLGRFDSIAGLVFGIVKMSFGIGLLCWLIDVIQISYFVNLFSGSFFYPKMVVWAPKVIEWISKVIPFQDIFHALKQTLTKHS